MQEQELGNLSELVDDLSQGISVITAVGPNTTPDQLFRCLESVATQQVSQPIEHIVIFDGDKAFKNSVTIMQQVVELYYIGKLDRKLCSIQVPWTGPGFAKNRGLMAHKHRYVAFLDSDDIFYNSNSLEALVTTALATDAEVVQGVVMLENGKTLMDPYDIKKYGVPSPLIISKREIFERCQVFKRANVAGKLFDSTNLTLKYNVESDMCDDVYGVVEAMYNASTVSVIPNKIYTICENPCSVSKSPSYVKLLAIRRYATWARNFSQEHCLPLPDKYYRDACYDFTLFGKRVLRINKWKYRIQILLFGKMIFQMNVGL